MTDHDVATVKKCILNALTNHFADLRESSQDSLPELAAFLYSKNVISRGTNKNPSFEKIMDSFIAGLNFRETRDDVLHFLEVLYSSFDYVGGPLSLAASKIRKEIESSI